MNINGFDFILFIIGLLILVKASQMTIKYSLKLAHLLRITELTVGFILIAISTSLPEFSIAIISSFEGEGILSVSNLVGSNIANIAIGFGLLGLLIPFRIKKAFFKEAVESIGITSVILIIMFLSLTLNFVFGFIALIIFVGYMFKIWRRGHIITRRTRIYGLKTLETLETIFLALIAIVFVVLSAKIVTESAINIASSIGLMESIIGVSLVAIGTSLPEFAIGFSALKRGNTSLVAGGLLGSIVTNLTLIMGFTAIISAVVLDAVTIYSIMFLLAFNLLFLFFAYKRKFNKFTGAVMLGLYALFLIFLVV